MIQIQIENIELKFSNGQNKLSSFSSGDKETLNNITSLIKKMNMLNYMFNMILLLFLQNPTFIFLHRVLLKVPNIIKEHTQDLYQKTSADNFKVQNIFLFYSF